MDEWKTFKILVSEALLFALLLLAFAGCGVYVNSLELNRQKESSPVAAPSALTR